MNDLLRIAINAAVEAGAKIEDIYNNHDFEIEIKPDSSPLTKADIAANNIINSFLSTTSIPIISEENKEIDFEIRKNWEMCWIVDPLDGTKEFLRKNGEFTVNIALVFHGKPILGVVFCPISKELFYGNVHDKKGYKLIVYEESLQTENWFDDIYKMIPKEKDDATVKLVGSRSHMNDCTLGFMKELKSQYPSVEVLSIGSSLKFCLIAEGNADIYPRFAPTMEWDTAAGQAICEAVGFHVLAKTTLLDLTYNKPNLLNSDFIVVNNTITLDKKWMRI
ncbi:3'(2'),5'-bisphosphate nucleotidase CysQ [Arenibacter sp. F26102]|uniref:3'(2'),5'-bisphosphate nucleotidase CysQ n=1 Tax=Arenibacter sp. F26102 TaxID=2926416 RepID=UPI001FF6B78E|nr:3'(2'),5'-bisphosphate nucleotidase CysQ [Arenibacter sp. F26102]MCK0147141.1 3'(2'),5'-bisphosphate nucleotidase CysQ [Arenibacter sp. F26102]